MDELGRECTRNTFVEKQHSAVRLNPVNIGRLIVLKMPGAKEWLDLARRKRSRSANPKLRNFLATKQGALKRQKRLFVPTRLMGTKSTVTGLCRKILTRHPSAPLDPLLELLDKEESRRCCKSKNANSR